MLFVVPSQPRNSEIASLAFPKPRFVAEKPNREYAFS